MFRFVFKMKQGPDAFGGGLLESLSAEMVSEVVSVPACMGALFRRDHALDGRIEARTSLTLAAVHVEGHAGLRG